MDENCEEYLDNLIDEDGEVRELTAADFARFKPFSSLPKEEQEMLLSLKGSKPETRHIVGLAPDVVASFRARGEGWEYRIDNVLREWLRDHAA